MKKLIILLIALLFVAPRVMANHIGGGINSSIDVEEFEPQVWLCGGRLVMDDGIQTGRISNRGEELVERVNNYAFTGEQIRWTVLVMDKNGREKIEDVFATLGDVQGKGGDIEANCVLNTSVTSILPECNARILEENITWNPRIMEYYTCTFTVETPESDNMFGKKWMTVEAVDLYGESGVMAENEYWFLNPVIALTIDGTMEFDTVRPGTSAYSTTVLIGNDADDGSGVMLDMFISGKDFYDTSSSGAMCPTSNQLELKNFKYFATNGAYSTLQDLRKDSEGYVGINYGDSFTPAFYNENEILQAQQIGPYYTANLLAPGSEMPITFRLDLPEPCNGDFDSGSIYFWGEAI